MIPTSRTSIVYNTPSKLLGLPPYYYRVRSCDTNLTSNTPANQYQRLKLIQNTVRVEASLYTSNLGPLSAYQNPGMKTHNVCWNQMSDRVYPSVQKTVVPSGTNCALNKKTTSVTSSRPGCQTPGGKGCDIKHNSYDRYLNRLKAKGPLRRGVVPENFGAPIIPFNPAYPIYGAKTTKTSIVSGCDCPIPINEQINEYSMELVENKITEGNKLVTVTNDTKTNDTKTNDKLQNDIQIYNNPLYKQQHDTDFIFNVGEYVFAKQSGDNYYTRAIIKEKNINNLVYLIQFDNGMIEIQSVNSLLLYYPCNCYGEINSNIYSSGFLVVQSSTTEFNPTCLYPIYIPGEPVL